MRGLYIHIPFCKVKCPYCAFYKKIPSSEAEMHMLVEMLVHELSSIPDRRFDTIYIGGGTPNVLPPKLLENLLEGILENVELSENYEWTVELNPELVDIEQLELFRIYGINRLSFGLQSTYDEELRFFGRLHRKESFHRKYELARKLGFGNVNVDLIFGSPLKDVDMWKKELEEVANLQPEHVSTYSLTIEKGTPFYTMNIRTRSEEELLRMFLIRDEVLSRYGYERYEISNYAKRGYESKHNLIYWFHEEYVGVGPSAHSFIKPNIRYTNVSDVGKYLENYENYRTYEYLNDEQLLLEEIFLKLRTRWGYPIEKRVDISDIEEFVSLEDGKLKLTVRGVVIADRIALEIFCKLKDLC